MAFPNSSQAGRTAAYRAWTARLVHVLIIPNLEERADEITIEGDEARRAVRVKRLAAGEMVRLIDGSGLVAEATVLGTKGGLRLRLAGRRRVDPLRPTVHVFAALPKGGRAAELVDNLVQVGAASWTPLVCGRSAVDPRAGKLSRLERVAVEAVRQSQRSHFMTINPPCRFADALTAEGGQALVLADPTGGSYTATAVESIRVLIGPEGGFTESELELFRRGGAGVQPQVISLGPHVMRIELAAAVAAALILAAERR